MANKKSGLLGNFSWKFAERISAQLVTTFVAILLARLLDPSDYGLIAMVTIFITLADVLVSDGLASALVQKNNADALDFSSFLYFNIVLSAGVYLILFFAAPFVSAFYGEGYEILTPILRVQGLKVLFTAVNSVQHAYVSKKMMFRNFFWATLTGTIVSGAVGVIMAYSGWGVWALVAQNLVSIFINTVALAIMIKKLPVLQFSFSRVKKLFGYGSRILGSSLLISGFVELRALIIGKMYSSADLAFYDKGRHFPQLIISNVNTSISAVLFPELSNKQDELEKVKEITRGSIRFCSFILCPMLMGLAAVARPFTVVVLTEKWLPCVPLMQMFCIIYLFQPIHSANMQAIKAMGRSDIYLWLEVIKKTVEVIALLITMWIGVNAIVVGMLLLTIVFTYVNAYPNIKLLNYTFREQMLDIFPVVACSLIMAAAVLALDLLPIPDFPLLIIQVVAGIVLYLLLCVVTRNKELKTVLDLIKKRKKK